MIKTEIINNLQMKFVHAKVNHGVLCIEYNFLFTVDFIFDCYRLNSIFKKINLYN